MPWRRTRRSVRPSGEKRIPSFVYKGSVRVEPHALGYDHDGDLTLSAYQLSGGSRRNFRDFHVTKLSIIAITDETFATARLAYRPFADKLVRVICRR